MVVIIAGAIGGIARAINRVAELTAATGDAFAIIDGLIQLGKADADGAGLAVTAHRIIQAADAEIELAFACDAVFAGLAAKLSFALIDHGCAGLAFATVVIALAGGLANTCGQITFFAIRAINTQAINGGGNIGNDAGTCDAACTITIKNIFAAL